jgi:hypothetical protein
MSRREAGVEDPSLLNFALTDGVSVIVYVGGWGGRM